MNLGLTRLATRRRSNSGHFGSPLCGRDRAGLGRCTGSCLCACGGVAKPDDSRQVVFTVLPGHGAVIVEKWVSGRRPFQVVWESMDAGILRVASRIPQGPMSYVPATDGRMVLQEEDEP